MDKADKEGQLLAQLAKIRESFLQRTRNDLPLLRDLLWRVGSGDLSGRIQLESWAHRIRGSGAIFDCPAVSEGAGQIEALLEGLAVTPCTSVIEAQTLRRLQECGARLALEIDAAMT